MCAIIGYLAIKLLDSKNISLLSYLRQHVKYAVLKSTRALLCS